MFQFSDQFEKSQKACHWYLNETNTFDMLRRRTNWYLRQGDPFDTLWRRTVHYQCGLKSLSSLLLKPILSVQVILPKLQNSFEKSENESQVELRKLSEHPCRLVAVDRSFE